MDIQQQIITKLWDEVKALKTSVVANTERLSKFAKLCERMRMDVDGLQARETMRGEANKTSD